MGRLAQATPVLLVLAWIACTEATSVREPAGLLLVSGSGQSGAAGEPLSEPLVVRAVDADGRATPGVGVSWTVTAGGGTVSGSTGSTAVTTTDQTGQTQVILKLGTAAGANAVSASISANNVVAPVDFTATGLPGPAAKLGFTVQPADAMADLAIAPAIQVAVQDVYGNT